MKNINNTNDNTYIKFRGQCQEKPNRLVEVSVFFCFYTSTKSWRGYIFTAVCLSVCMSVRLCLWTKFQPNKWADLDAVFAKRLLTLLAQTLLKLVTLGQRSRSQWRNIHFFLHNSLLTSLLYISALLCLIIMKFDMSLRYTLGRFCSNFLKIE